jgi:hypothetical protein
MVSSGKTKHQTGYRPVYRDRGTAALWRRIPGYGLFKGNAPVACPGSGRNRFCFL